MHKSGEDMSHEHITHHGQYLWDMKMIDLARRGRAREILDIMPEFTVQAISETDSGAFSWMLETLGVPDYPAELYAYGTVIGTGNAIMAWWNEAEQRAALGIEARAAKDKAVSQRKGA
jgi:2-aminophenol/2-amino-5-chlorophenol 1,6-dioxygenase beta subunit